MKFIVTGSLWHISKPLTPKLIQDGHSVTVISNKAQRKKKSKPWVPRLGCLEDYIKQFALEFNKNN